MQTIRLQHLDAHKHKAILDVGCGTGRHITALYLEGFTKIFGLDINAADIAQAQRQVKATRQCSPKRSNADIKLQVGDGTRLPFRNAQFSSVICSEVLEHVPDYYRMLDEIARVLKPKGLLGVSVPRQGPETICWWLSRAYHEAAGGHIRIFRPRELIADIEARGFRLLRRHWAHGLHSPWWWLKCALGVKASEQHVLVRSYHRLLVWEMLHPSWFTRLLQAIFDPLMGKSIVLYFEKQAAR